MHLLPHLLFLNAIQVYLTRKELRKARECFNKQTTKYDHLYIENALCEFLIAFYCICYRNLLALAA